MSHSTRFHRLQGFGVSVALVAFGVTAAGCNETDGFSQEEWSVVEQLEPLKGPKPDNPYNNVEEDDDVAKLGQMLFWDKDVAEAITADGPSGKVGETRKVACVNCHDNKYFSDSHQTPGISHGRSWLGTNSGALVNLAWYKWTLWAGRFDSMVDHGAGVWGTSATPLAQARFMYKKYNDEWNTAFPDFPLDPRLGIPATDPTSVYPATGGPKANPAAADGVFEKMPADAVWNGMTPQEFIHQFRARVAKVFETYPRKLMTPDSPFQKYVRDRDFSQLSERAKNGLRLFIGKAACNDCHNGPTLTDNKFHNIGAQSQIMLPGATTPLAPNRGRAGAYTTLLDQFARSEKERTAFMEAGTPEKEWVYHGASRFSDARQAGIDRLNAVKDDDAQRCIMRNEMTQACMQYDESLEGAFRTPSLLNIAMTGPYFHGGLTATLEDVVNHYNQGGGEPGSFVGVKSPQIRPLHLTQQEVGDIVEFLKSLTGVAPIDQQPLDGSGGWNWGKNIAKAPLPLDPPPATP
jgi:cytochrome c peroxidase